MLKRPTLLLFTENPSIRFLVKKHLEEQCFILTAENREQALEALHAKLDCILVDAHTEHIDPLILCQNLSQATQKLTPIFLLTGRLNKDFRDKALRAGVTDLLNDTLDLSESLHTLLDTLKPRPPKDPL